MFYEYRFQGWTLVKLCSATWMHNFIYFHQLENRLGSCVNLSPLYCIVLLSFKSSYFLQFRFHVFLPHLVFGSASLISSQMHNLAFSLFAQMLPTNFENPFRNWILLINWRLAVASTSTSFLRLRSKAMKWISMANKVFMNECDGRLWAHTPSRV